MTVEIYFQRHGVSLWNRRVGTASYLDVMEQFGIGSTAAEKAGVDLTEWNRAMERTLSACVNSLMRDDPVMPPPADVTALDPLFVDPPLTLEGKKGLRMAGAAAARADFCPNPFVVSIASPMLRTLQTAAIATVYLPFADDCRWIIDSDAREHNHTGWVDTWGTASSSALRRRAEAEIAAAVGPAEAGACAIRAPLQKAAIEAATDGLLYEQSLILRQHAEGIFGFCEGINAPVGSSEDDASAARIEAEKWTNVVASNPEFRYRPQGALGSEQVVTKYCDDFENRWWLLDESEADVQKRVEKMLACSAVRGAKGPVLIVTHSMFIRQAMDALVGPSTRWTGPAPMPAEKKLVDNGAIFKVILDLATGQALEAGLFSPPRARAVTVI